MIKQSLCMIYRESIHFILCGFVTLCSYEPCMAFEGNRRHGCESLSFQEWALLCVCVCVCQERIGVKMMMIQDGPMPTGADKPLRITGDPYKVQVRREA